MRIGIFGGSFDPVHTEHVNVAESAVKTLKLDKLFIMPAFAPPHKKDKILSPDQDRLAACRLAFSDVEKTEVSDYEIARGGTSYTYLTCKDFSEKYPGSQLFFIVGTDMLRDFPTWKNPEEILSYATLAVCARDEEKGWLKKEQESFYARFHKNFQTLAYEGKAVSSTMIRALAAAGERLTPYVPEAVETYILEKGLYEIPFVQEALALEKPNRRAHSIRVALTAASRAAALKIPERKVIAAALFHDCAKNISADSPLLEGFIPPCDVPNSVWHQYAGEFLARTRYGVEDEDVLNAIKYHTSGRENMSPLEELIFLADMVEPERNYDVVEKLRALFYEGDTLAKCMEEALKGTLLHLEKKGALVYNLTREAYEFYSRKKR